MVGIVYETHAWEQPSYSLQKEKKKKKKGKKEKEPQTKPKSLELHARKANSVSGPRR